MHVLLEIVLHTISKVQEAVSLLANFGNNDMSSLSKKCTQVPVCFGGQVTASGSITRSPYEYHNFGKASNLQASPSRTSKIQ